MPAVVTGAGPVPVQVQLPSRALGPEVVPGPTQVQKEPLASARR